jgi:hypothetical protein
MKTLLLIAAVALSAAAQDTTETLADEFRGHFKKRAFNLGILIQAVGDFQIERNLQGNNGFSVANARLRVDGELDRSFAYVVQAKFDAVPTVLDARVSYAAATAVTIDAGLMKTPFSSEFLTYVTDVDFVNRSQAVALLAPGRQVGIQVRGRLANDRFGYAVGAFNGNGIVPAGNDNDNLMYAGRFGVMPISEESRRLEVGVHAALSHDDNADLVGGAVPGFAGNRDLYGADARLTLSEWQIGGEVVGSRLDPSGPAPASKPYGYHLTGGYRLSPKMQGLVRWDSFHGDGLINDADFLVVGLNVWPTSVTKLQVNYAIPTKRGGLRHNQLLINVQVSL